MIFFESFLRWLNISVAKPAFSEHTVSMMAHALSYAATSYLVADYLIVVIIRIHSTVKSKHDYEGDLHWGKEKKKSLTFSWLHAEFLCRTSFKPLMSCSYLHFVVLFWDVSCLV